MNQALIDNLTIEEKIRYGIISNDIADTITTGDNAMQVLDNWFMKPADYETVATGIANMEKIIHDEKENVRVEYIEQTMSIKNRVINFLGDNDIDISDEKIKELENLIDKCFTV